MNMVDYGCLDLNKDGFPLRYVGVVWFVFLFSVFFNHIYVFKCVSH